MSDNSQDRVFIPFNFSAVLPFDSLASALNELPTVHPTEPQGPLSLLPLPSIQLPSSQEEAEMTRLMMSTCQDEEWRREISSELQQFEAISSKSQNHQWLHPFCNRLSSNMQMFSKRSNPVSSPPRRSTPKRPRPQLATPSSNYTNPDRSFPANSEHQSIANHSAPRVRSASKRTQLSHTQELKRQEQERIVDSENYISFLNIIQSFLQRPNDFASDAHDENPDLLATESISDVRDLHQAVRLGSAQGVIGNVPSDTLSRVVSVLHTRVRHCIQQTFSYESSKKKSQLSNGYVSLGVLAGIVILSILSAPSVPQTLLVQEVLEDLAECLRCIATSVIFPMGDPLYKSGPLKTKKNSKSRHGRSTPKRKTGPIENADEESDDETDSKRPTIRRDESLLRNYATFLDGFSSLFLKESHLSEELVDKCAMLCVHSMSVAGISRLQSHAIRLASTIFYCYPDRRIYILDEARESIKHLPASRKQLRTYELSEDQCAIRSSSALIAMLLTTACNDLEEGTNRKCFAVFTKEKFKSWCDVRLKRYHRALKLGLHVLEPLFDRACAERDVELRTAFQTFFEDLLTLYGRPEWPSAELLLQTLSVSIIRKLRAPTEKSVYARVIAIETLGAVASKICEVHGDHISSAADSTTQHLDLERIEQERVKVLTFLGQKNSLHAESAGLFLEALFFSDDYNMNKNNRKTSPNEKPRNSGKGDKETIEEGPHPEADLLQSRTLQRLEKLSIMQTREEDVPRTEALAALRYVSAHRSFANGFKTIISTICEGMHDPAPTIRAKSIKSLSSIESSRQGLFRVFPNVLPFIEASCRDVSILARDAALELLSRSLMPETSALTESYDIDIEASSLFNNILEIVLKRMCDTATSVRKRAISISRTVLSRTLKASNRNRKASVDKIGSYSDLDNHLEQRIIQICTGLVQRLDDPEASVRELSERVMRFALFGYDATNTSTWGRGEESEEALQFARRLTNLYVLLPSNIHISFMARVVHKAMLIKEKPLLLSVVSASVMELHSHETLFSKMSVTKNSSNIDSQEFRQLGLLSKKRLACSSVICALGSLDPSLIEPHCKSLAPSIKGVIDGSMSESDLIAVQRILNVLEVGLGQSTTVDKTLIDEVLSDVEVIVCQSPTIVLEEASVKCFCVVASKANLNQAIERSALAFKEFLDGEVEHVTDLYLKRDSHILAFERHARCALVRLGLLSRYGSLDDHFTSDIYKTLSRFSRSIRVVDFRGALSKACMRALSHFLIGHRGFLQDGTNIFLSFMETGDDKNINKNGAVQCDANGKMELARQSETSSLNDGVQQCILQGFHELLRDEEERNLSGKELSKDGDTGAPDHGLSKRNGRSLKNRDFEGPDVTQPVLAAEEDAEAGYLALSAQAMFIHVKTCARSPSVAIRRTVANIVGLLVRQGLLLPANVVPCLFGLLLDKDAGCREFAMRVIAFIADRHSGMLTSATIPALKSCFKDAYTVQYHSDHENMFFDKIASVCIDMKTGQSLLSGALMSLRREQRRGVLENIMREFDPKIIIVEKIKADDANRDKGNIIEKVHDDDDDDDDDDNLGMNGSVDMDVTQCDNNDPRQACLATLYFMAITVACIDYTNGAGIGGSLSQGGGTAVAEGRMKTAREDVTDLVGIATRIISNSGQAILRLAKHVTRNDHVKSRLKKRKVARLAARMSLLLRLKHHLKVERWKSVSVKESGRAQERYEDEEDNVALDENQNHNRHDVELGNVCRMPIFRAESEVLSISEWDRTDLDALSNECVERQLREFQRLMSEDAIDEADVSVVSRRGRAGVARSGRGDNRLKSVSVREKGVHHENEMTTPGSASTSRLASGGGSGEGRSEFSARSSVRLKSRRKRRVKSRILNDSSEDDGSDDADFEL